MVGWLIYDPLTISDDKGKIYPNLSTSWEIATDGLTYTFKLRNDVKFHDGTVFDATAVKYNLDRVVDPKTASPLSADDIGPYDSSTVVDDYTVAIKLKSGYGPLLRMLSLQEFGLISPTAADKEGLDGFGRHPVGTGPFKFVEWVAQDHITVAANPDYSWASTNIYSHSGPPYLDQVVYKYIIENQAREAALQTGEADAILNVPPQDVSKLQGDKDLQILKFAALGVPTSFILNANRPPTNDPAVRKALNQGLNRQQIVATLYADQNTPAYGALTPASFGYWDGGETANKYDLEGAKKTLDDAGWKTSGSNGTREKDGQKLTVELYVFPGTEPNAVAVQAALTELKVDIKITQAPWSDQATIGYQGKHNGIVVTFGAPDPRILRLLYDTANFSPNGWYWTHFKEADPKLQQQLDDLLNQGDSEDDPSKRVEIYQNAQEILIDNNLVLPVKNDFQIVGLKQTVQGWKMDDQNYQPRLYDVWLNK